MNPTIARFYWSNLPNARCILDLGCDKGNLGHYKPKEAQVYGLDLNAAALAQAQHYETVQVWDLDTPAPLPFSDIFFDAVVAKDILEHLQKPWRTLAEIRRVTRPGGIILASVISERGHRTWGDYTHVRGFTMNSVRQMFSDAGFHVVQVWRMGGIPFTSRLDLIHMVPYLLRFPVFDWLWTSSYEIKAIRPE